MTSETKEILHDSEETFDLDETASKIALEVMNSSDVRTLAQQIKYDDPNTIINYGIETAKNISGFSDRILHSIETSTVEDSGNVITQLNKIMDKFDIKDFEESKPGILQRMFNKARHSIDMLFEKYHTMGNEVDKLYIQLKQYEEEIKDTNVMLEEMFDTNITHYEMLEKYIQGGKLAIQQFKDVVIPKLEQEARESSDQMNQINLSNGHQMLEMLEQRVYDLELSKNIALQLLPQIKLIQKGNYNLVRKINTAFIITIPIFKQCLTQAITLKRQAIQAKAMAALDEKTNELLIRNAQNTVVQSKLIAELSSSSSIQIETLEETWNTIMKGIEESRLIQEDIKKKRTSGVKKIQEIQNQYLHKSHID
ncbi:uncharacterized protein YaaN involved in tellurite resistance [Anaerosolibacter carboniphilus]|uniref:Uncharacterized protein YaaN involved in tellurite resistance n=1 Tax=Anaerosolibacter carboniphilus TaxID=1417629 RepID=A0A841L0T1_9FIRM|nr:toxic anion resistance protein [Anaerosolibacter carboniphilus]MBB6215989.1 uncharacterized protein YaaN involved in tellurite resistance [Anaerosolibacter carboniphilus]